nr:DeoR/GlpR family DNA-binding transcription regulator [Antribacter gilvus]
MLPAQRRDELLRVLRTEGRVVAKDFAVRHDLSEDSVRRDLRELAAAGLCQRVYGGALPVSPAVADYAGRQSVAVENKDRVARKAAELVRPGSTAILDGGTTALAVARALPPDLRATIVTHSPTVAAALAVHPTVEVLVLGGRLFKHSVVTSGSITAEAAAGIWADVFLLGVTGVHPEAGLTTGDPEEAAMKRTLAGRAGDTYVLASAEKIGAASAFRVLPLSEVTGIVTDVPLDGPAARALLEAGAPLLAAG